MTIYNLVVTVSDERGTLTILCGVAGGTMRLPVPGSQAIRLIAMPTRLQHLLLTTTEDPFDIRSWSGIPYSLRMALERQVDQVSVFVPSRPRRTPLDVIKRLILGAKKYPLWITRTTLRQNARQLKTEIARIQPDAVLSISSQMIAYLADPGVPVILFSDAPYMAFHEAYAEWENAPIRLEAYASEEAKAGSELSALCFGSAWACDEARRLYSLNEQQALRLHATPLGANWVPGQDREEIFRRIDGRSFERIELLFIGRDWERKGGPLAVEVSRLLRQAGYDVHLHVVGCQPELGSMSGPGGFVTLHGLLYRDDPVQSATLAELFLSSHFLLVPSVAECFGIIFAEAQAFGLPPVARRVHALPSVVVDEGQPNSQTGLLFDLAAPASEYVTRIVTLLADVEGYREMARRARQRFEDHLNWDSTAKAVLAAIPVKTL